MNFLGYPDEQQASHHGDERSHKCASSRCPMVGTLSNDTAGSHKTFYCRFHYFGGHDEAHAITERLWRLTKDYGMTIRASVLTMLYPKPMQGENEFTRSVKTNKSVEHWSAEYRDNPPESERKPWQVRI